jgi:hypothetical protein
VHAAPSMQPSIVVEVVVVAVVGTTAAVVVEAMVTSESHNPQLLGHDMASLARIGLVQSTGDSANTLHTAASTFTGHGPNAATVVVVTVSVDVIVDVIVEVSVELASSAIVPLQLLHATGQSALISSRKPLVVSEQSDTSVHKMGLSSLPSQTDAAAEGRVVAKRIATTNASQDHHLGKDPALRNPVVEIFLVVGGGRAAPFPPRTRGEPPQSPRHTPGENPLLAGVDIPIAESIWQVRQLPTYSALPSQAQAAQALCNIFCPSFNQTVDKDN